MAVVTEPPWVNQASGVSPRNGTISHTIPFGWTSASGSELVVIVYGAVTHAAGWTERLQPVQTGELSVFTKTSAGDTSITVTHNAANFPVGWVAYELPAGSTWVDGVGSNVNADTFPTLGSLPGVEVVVFAARGRVASGGETGASSVWSAPWVEDADAFEPDTGTDGFYLTAGHQINVTATSVTPAAASTYSGTFPADRQHVVFAYNVTASGGGGSSVAPTGVAVALGLGTPALAWSGSVAPDGLGVPVAVGGPIVGAVGVQPDGVGVPVTVVAPAVAWSGLVAPDGVGVAVAVGAAGVSVPGMVVRRPFEGSVARPSAGVVVRPVAGVVSRP